MHFNSYFQKSETMILLMQKQDWLTLGLMMSVMNAAFAVEPGKDATIMAPEDSSKKVNAPSRVYITSRLTTEIPVVDGNLSDACWNTGTWAGDYIQWIPTEGAKASQRTELKVLYDEN